MNRKTFYQIFSGGLLLLFFGFITACEAPKRKAEAVLDTPEHHVFSGNKLLQKEDYDGALREFQLAIELDPKYPPAHAGTGLVYGYKKDFKKAFENMEKALDLAKTKEHKVEAHTGMVRLHSMERGKDWLSNCEREFKKAIGENAAAPDPYYYMGIAYKRSETMEGVGKAGDMFKKVLEINKDLVADANKEWEIVQKIQRAAPGTKIGVMIALADKITRADLSALFVQELDIEKLFKKRGVKTFDTSFKSPTSPQKFEADKLSKAAAATDIENHVLRTDMETAIGLGIRGLESYPDHTFHPNQPITKVEYAVMVEDILIKVSGDESLATKFIGSQPHFPDVRADQWFFNAIEVCNARGIMQAEDLTTGEFKPKNPVSGADALLIIRKLKDELKFF
ncbi:MAG: S-layer homology domain-containing protein [Nitrospinae bacterium]|nr:S-layer homology domain-containing protein [Nitrospinota bacterium]